MKDSIPVPASQAEKAMPPMQPMSETQRNRMGASFDMGETASPDPSDESGNALSGLKKLQDHSKYQKARFSFRLYKR